MENSRKFRRVNKRSEVETEFERALEQIQARVSVLARGKFTSLGIAYSGGLDSSVLLHLACRYAQGRSIKVYAFHVHHGFSPNADSWLEHCDAQANRLGAQFEAVKLHIDAQSISAHGIEQAARIARYQALAAMCQRNGLGLLLTAHHQDDQAETLMLQLMRGAGLPGLSAMALMQEEHALLGAGLVLARPLLDLSRAALEGYARQHGLSHIVDESNVDVSFRRNALRQLVFPLLQEHFSGFAACVARSAAHIRTAQELLNELAESDLQQCRKALDETTLSLNELSALSPQRCNNVLRHWLHGLGIQMPSTSRLEELRQQLLDARHDRQPLVELGSFALSRTGQHLVLHSNLGRPPTEEILIQWLGEAEIPIPGWRGTLVFDRVEAGGMPENKLLATPLAIRTRGGQERLKLAVNRPSKTLKNLYQEAAIPAWQREWLPLAYLDRQLVFVAGLGTDVRHQAQGAGIALRWRFDREITR